MTFNNKTRCYEFQNGKELHDYLEKGLKEFGTEFEDAELYDDRESYEIHPVDFGEAIKLNYLSLETETGEECYLYEPVVQSGI